MFEQMDFFDDDNNDNDGKLSEVTGKIFLGLLHVAKVTFLIYSGYHGISATLNYSGSGQVARVAQVVGIVTLELTLFALYGAYHNQKITGAAQSVAAGITYAVGFILACLGIVADSQLHAGFEVSTWLKVYMTTFLPLSPAVMALGALFTHELSPTQIRKRHEASAKNDLMQVKFEAKIAQEKAKVDFAKLRANMQLNAQLTAMKTMGTWYGSEEAQKAITGTALQNAPALLRAAGFDVKDNGVSMPSANGDPLPTSSTPPHPTNAPQGLINDDESGEDDEPTQAPIKHTNGVTKTVLVQDDARPKA